MEFTTAQHSKYNETWCPTIEEWVKKTDTVIFSNIKKDEGLWSAEKEIQLKHFKQMRPVSERQILYIFSTGWFLDTIKV